MSTDLPATKSWFSFQFSLASLVFMSVVAGVLFLVNFQKNENWQVCYECEGYGLPLYTKPTEGYGWPCLVRGQVRPDERVEWSWIGLCGNIVFSCAALFLLGTLFEVICRWRRKEITPQFSAWEWLVVVACVSAVLVLNCWPRNINVPGHFIGLVNVHSVRGWPCAGYSVPIIRGVTPEFLAVERPPVYTGFDGGKSIWIGLVLDLFLGLLFCGFVIRFMLWRRRRRRA